MAQELSELYYRYAISLALTWLMVMSTTVLTQYSNKGVLCFVEVYLLWNCGVRVCVCVRVKIHGWAVMEILFWIVNLIEQNHKYSV